MKKFVKFSKLKELKKTELQSVKGGKPYIPLYGVLPLYGVNPFPLYGISPDCTPDDLEG